MTAPCFRAEFFSLEASAAHVDAAYRTLPPDERARADRLEPARRRRFLIARSRLRSAIGAQLNVDPADIAITYGTQGKPLLGGEPCPLYFNTAHTRDLAVVATTTRGPIGADLERVDRVQAWDRIAVRYFTPWERAAIDAFATESRRAAFIRTWVRKEAYVKALGVGISPAFRDAEVTVSELECHIRRVGTPDDSPERWVLADLEAPAGYLASVAVRANA